jgi:phospholipid transport system substrate-binding protein
MALPLSWRRCDARRLDGMRRRGGGLPALVAAIIGLSVALTGRARATLIDADAPRGAVSAAIDDAIAILHNTRIPLEQRRRELRALAERNLDLAKMAENVLGTHWTQMTPEQQREFVPLFEAFIEAAYLGEIQEYAKLKIDVGRQTLDGTDYARVAAEVLQPGEDPIEITFLLERTPRGWLMYDVVVDDISMVENYRAQFDRVIRTRGLSRLEADLRLKQAKLDAMLGQ